MRQLFLPACVCFATWSGATNSDPRFTLEDFTAPLAVKHRVPPQADSTREAEAEVIANVKLASLTPENFARRTESLPEQPAVEEVSAALADLAIEPPVPSGKVINNGEPAGIPLPPIAKPVVARSEEEVCGTLAEAAQRNNLPAPFFIRLLFQESRFKPGVVSSAGAEGIAQFMPATSADMGVDNPFDPLQAIPASARLLRALFEKFGNLGLAAAAYNAGPKRIADWLADKRKNKLPEETQGYVKTITGKPVENWASAHARHPEPKLPQRAPCQKAAGLLAWNGPDAVPVPTPAPLRVAAAEARQDAKTKLKPDEKKTVVKVAAQQPTAQKHKHKPERVAQR